MPRKSTSKKPRRAREYTGPHTLEAVKAFMVTDATQKAKNQAIETLSSEDQLKVMEWAKSYLQSAVRVALKDFEIERKRRGYTK